MVLPISSIVQGAKSLVTPLIQPLFVPFLYWTLSSLGTIMNVWTNGDRLQDENDFLNPLQAKPYDFIIVGAGSAGCLLANRLSRSYTVLLIEAGGEPNPLQFIPGFSLFFPNFPELDWQHRTVPQRFGSLMSVNGESSWSTGLGLGGSGTLNYMIHLRGHRRDFDNWANITGDPSWSWEGVLPYFKSYENYEIPGDPVNHGYNGDLRIEAPDFPATATDFVRAGVELGYPHVDLNAPFSEGFDIVRYGMSRGVRQAPFKAFLEPVRFRSSLTIMKFAQVNKILFQNGNVAYGVEYDRHGRTYVARASREVIVSAGTVGTPKLLMLSGIGPQQHLSDMNIPVISNLPVGENLQDHLGVYLAPFFIRPGRGFFLDRDITIGEFIKWFTLGRGRLTNSGCEATGLISSSFAKSRGEGDWPDIQLFTYGFSNFRDGAENLARIFNLKYDEVDKYTRNDVGRDSIYVVLTGSRPVSRGYIRLGGSSPYDKLEIDPNYLGDQGEMDVQVLLEGVKRALFLMENTTAGGVDMGARFTTTRLPGCEDLEFRSDAYWTCFIRRYSVTLHHPVGTASMGTVVDTELRVLGTRNLRVVDASVQPQAVVTNTQASTLMIAEKAADMINKFWMGGDQGKKINLGLKKKPLLGLFGGGLKGKEEVWWGNQKRDAALRKGLSYPVGPAGVPMKWQVPGVKVNEEVMKQKLRQSFEDLKLVSELARDNYNRNFNSGKVTTTTTRVPTRAPATTTTPYSTSTSTGGYPGNVGYTGGKWGQQQEKDEEEYYDDDEGFGSAGEEYEDDGGGKGGNSVPRPPAPPKPPAASTARPAQPRLRPNPQNYYSTPEATTTRQPAREFLRLKGNSNNPNSLDDIEQYYDKNYHHQQHNYVSNNF